MPVGMTIYNDSGAIQIDGEGIHYDCTGTGTVTTTTILSSETGTYGSRALAVFPANSTSLYAFRCDAANGVHVRAQFLSSGRRYILWVLGGDVGTTVQWYRFDPMVQNQSNGAGFDIYTPTGAIAFSLGSKPLAIRELINVTRSYAGGTIPLSSGRQYAVIPSAQLGFEDEAVFQGVNGRDEAIYSVNTGSLYVRNNGGSVTITQDRRTFLTRNPSSSKDNNGQALIVDVTYL